MQNSVLLKHRTAAWMLFLCLFGIAAALAAYQAIWPEASGKDVQKSKSLVVDASNCSQGYIMAHGGTGMKQLKLRVTQGKYKLTYDLGSAGESRFSWGTALIPLSCLRTYPERSTRQRAR